MAKNSVFETSSLDSSELNDAFSQRDAPQFRFSKSPIRRQRTFRLGAAEARYFDSPKKAVESSRLNIRTGPDAGWDDDHIL